MAPRVSENTQVRVVLTNCQWSSVFCQFKFFRVWLWQLFADHYYLDVGTLIATRLCFLRGPFTLASLILLIAVQSAPRLQSPAREKQAERACHSAPNAARRALTATSSALLVAPPLAFLERIRRPQRRRRQRRRRQRLRQQQRRQQPSTTKCGKGMEDGTSQQTMAGTSSARRTTW